MNSITTSLNGIIKNVPKDRQILAVFLFGSRIREDHQEHSDLDICLVLQPGSYSAQQLSEKKLAYLSDYPDLDIQIYQQLPIYIRKRVFKEGKMIFCRDEAIMYELAFTLIREFSDFEYFYREYLKEVAHGGSGTTA